MNTSLRLPLQAQDPNIPSEDTIVPVKPVPVKSELCLNALNKSSDKVNELTPGHFRKILSDTKEQLVMFCSHWSTDQESLDNVNNVDTIKGDIRTVVGQAHLVMDERFTQFNGLIDNCEFKTSEKPVTFEDLQGFWDMIYVQVQDVIKKFNDLEKRKMNNWKSEIPNIVRPKKLLKKCKGRTSGEMAAAASRREAARKRLAAAKATLKKEKQSSVITFDAGFFQVDSPIRKKSVDKRKTPSSLSRKKTVTPKSDNFMHGRIVKKITKSSSKKTLNFDMLSSEKKSLTALNQDSPTDKPPNDPTEFKENQAPNLGKLTTPRRTASAHASRTVAVMTDSQPSFNNTFETAFQTIFDQMKIISGAQDQLKPNYLPEMQEKLRSLEEENKTLKHDISGLQQTTGNLPEVVTSDQFDNVYEGLYKRQLEKCKLLQAELSAYKEVKNRLASSEGKLQKTFELFQDKTKSLAQFHARLKAQKETLDKREKQENVEMQKLAESNSKLCEEIETLKNENANYSSLIEEHKSLSENHQQLINDNSVLIEAHKSLRHDNDELLEKFNRQSDELDALQKEIQTDKENCLFEREEFMNDKAYMEEEKNLLESQLYKTEETLESTLKLLQKVKDKAESTQIQVDEHKLQLHIARQELIQLREESDISKVNSRLALMEKQQEVGDCKEKIRVLLDEMASFLLTLKQSTDKRSVCQDLPLLSDHPLKTPSKSLVVSAILRHENQQSESELSPDDKFDRKSGICLFSLVSDVFSLMDNIRSTAALVAARYELEKKQLLADKSNLQSRVDSLKVELSNQNRSEKDVEKSLRRRLHEVMSERDLLRHKLTSNK